MTSLDLPVILGARSDLTLKPRFIFTFSLILLLLTPLSVTADSGALGRIGDSVQPLEHTQVKMVSKDVTAEVNVLETYFEAVFTFHNDGPETTVLMGFPEASGMDREPSEEHPYRRFHQDLEDFTTYIDGEMVEVEREEGLLQDSGLNAVEFPNWYTWKVDFAEDETVVVKNTYRAPNSVEAGILTSTGYIKSTGATWQGSIGEARITFKLQDISPHQLIFAVPPGFQVEDGNLIWEWENLEPRHNIEISFNIHFSGHMREYNLSDKTIEVWDDWDEKLRDRNYSRILSETENILKDTTSEEDELFYLASAYRCIAHEKLGNSRLAITGWEQLIEDLGAPEQVTGSLMGPDLKGYFYNKAHYRLAGLYHKAGQTDELIELYSRTFEGPPNAPLKRLIESFLPPEKVRVSDPVINRAEVEENMLVLEAEDSDGDLAEVKFALWEKKDGETILIFEKEIPAYPSYFSYFYYNLTPGMVYSPEDLYKLDMIYQLEQLFPGVEDLDPGGDYFYSVEVSDFTGNRDTTGKKTFDAAFLAEEKEEVAGEEDLKPSEEETDDNDQEDPMQAETNQYPAIFLVFLILIVVVVTTAVYLVQKKVKG